MAYDPHQEDYQRLALHFTRSLDESDPYAASRSFASFGRIYAQDRDSLPQSDADRAFHLVAEATALIDYQLPFATDEEAETLITRAHAVLDEALSLDSHCYDALRMKTAAVTPTFEGYYDFLRENAAEVRAHCEEARQAAAQEDSDDRASLATEIAMRPYYRWLAMLANKAVICGHNREALRYAQELLELDPHDEADVRFTAALAYAKLEDLQGLDALEQRLMITVPGSITSTAWSRLAHASIAYRNRDFDMARAQLKGIVASYPRAAIALGLQRELPDGIYARLAVPPFSENELLLAVSEATVFLQEGRDTLGRGSFGLWTMLESLALATKTQLAEMHEVVEAAAEAARGGSYFGPQDLAERGNNGSGGTR